MPAGRPTDFSPDYIEQGKKLAELGATDREIAEFFEVSERTVYRWQHDHEEFCQALKAGKDKADERVVKSLYRRAVGYTHDAVKIMQYEGSEVIVPYEEHHPPDVTACIFWLKNRRSAEWRDRVETSVNGQITVLVSRDGAMIDVTPTVDRITGPRDDS